MDSEKEHGSEMGVWCSWFWISPITSMFCDLTSASYFYLFESRFPHLWNGRENAQTTIFWGLYFLREAVKKLQNLLPKMYVCTKKFSYNFFSDNHHGLPKTWTKRCLGIGLHIKTSDFYEIIAKEKTK